MTVNPKLTGFSPVERFVMWFYFKDLSMSVSKLELRAQIKMLRAQFIQLEIKCQKREVKV